MALDCDETARCVFLTDTIVRVASLPAECDPAHRVGLDGDLFEVIARHTLEGADINALRPRYNTGKHHLPVALAQGGRTIELRLGSSGMSVRGMMLPFA